MSAVERIEDLIRAAGEAGLHERREGLRDALNVIRRAPVSAGKVKGDSQNNYKVIE